MSKSLVKITGVAALSLAVTAMVYVFWPVETQRQKENEVNLEPQPKAQKLEESQTVEPAKPKQPETAQQESPGPTAEKLYEMALFQKDKTDSSPEMSYIMIVHCCRQILEQYPNSPQVEAAAKLLHEVPERYQKEYDEEMRFAYPSKPKVKKSKTLRHRVPRQRPRQFEIAIEDKSDSN